MLSDLKNIDCGRNTVDENMGDDFFSNAQLKNAIEALTLKGEKVEYL